MVVIRNVFLAPVGEIVVFIKIRRPRNAANYSASTRCISESPLVIKRVFSIDCERGRPSFIDDCLPSRARTKKNGRPAGTLDWKIESPCTDTMHLPV